MFSFSIKLNLEKNIGRVDFSFRFAVNVFLNMDIKETYDHHKVC